MKVVWSDTAIADLRNIHEHVAAASPENADRLVLGMLAAVDLLEGFPAMGRMVPEFEAPEVREVTHRKYRIIYRQEADRVLVLTVVHGSRDLARMRPKPWEIT